MSFTGTVGREEIAMIASKKLPSPSSYGKPNGDDGWEDPKLKMLQKYMCFHRFAGDSDKQATPVVLLDPILAQVSHDCQRAIPLQLTAHSPLLWHQKCLKHILGGIKG